MTDHQATVKRFDIPQTMFAAGGMLHGEGSETMVRASDYDALHQAAQEAARALNTIGMRLDTGDPNQYECFILTGDALTALAQAGVKP